MKTLTKKQQDILRQLYNKGIRYEADVSDAMYKKLQGIKDFETLPAAINNFLWDYHFSVMQGEQPW